MNNVKIILLAFFLGCKSKSTVVEKPLIPSISTTITATITDAAFPKCFQDGIIDENENKALLTACGLEGWALCMSGKEPPKNFGVAMAKIGKILGIAPTAENLSEYAKQQGWLK